MLKIFTDEFEDAATTIIANALGYGSLAALVLIPILMVGFIEGRP